MGVLGKYGSNAIKYYGSIMASAYANHSTADMWNSIRNAQAQYGLSRPGATAPDVSVIRGYANRIVNGARNLASADRADTITSDMMAVAPYTSRDLNSINTNPIYQVRYLNTVQSDDGTITQVWNTSVFTATDMPDTVGGLIDAIDTNASELAAQGSDASTTTPRGTSLSTSDHEITLV
jgi:hypothetical protein